jgi:hypothetical protein
MPDEVDTEFEKYLQRIEALPEAKKKEIRDHLLKQAGIKGDEEVMKEHTFEFWLGIRIENEAIQATIHDSEEKQARILDAYKKTMAALASVLRSAENTEIIVSVW